MFPVSSFHGVIAIIPRNIEAFDIKDYIKILKITNE